MNENTGNLKGYALVTDSASDISKEFAKKYNINVVPIYIHYNGKEFKDGVDINSNQIYSLQREKRAVFNSSSPSPHDFAQVYEKLLKSYKKIFSIHISSKLSAVIKSARIARGLIRAEKRIKIFDSLSGTMGTGFMVLAAARSILKKYSCDRILFLLNFLRDNMKMYGTIDTLKYLRRSGRVPAITGLISGILKIKPILEISNGVVEMVGIAVTRRGSLAEIVRRVIKDFKKERWVIVSIIHTLSFKESERIMKKIQSSLNCVDTMITGCTPVIGAHTGPGLVGVIVSKLNRDVADLFI